MSFLIQIVNKLVRQFEKNIYLNDIMGTVANKKPWRFSNESKKILKLCLKLN
jgi:hypothetical protein